MAKPELPVKGAGVGWQQQAEPETRVGQGEEVRQTGEHPTGRCLCSAQAEARPPGSALLQAAGIAVGSE